MRCWNRLLSEAVNDLSLEVFKGGKPRGIQVGWGPAKPDDT